MSPSTTGPRNPRPMPRSTSLKKWSPLVAAVLLISVAHAAARAQLPSDHEGAAAHQAEAWPVDPESVPRPTLEAARATGPVALDGRVDEPAWDATPVATDFIQSKPRTGHPASERTEVRVLFDDRYLYIGAILFDSSPGSLVAQHLEQDFLSLNDDVFGGGPRYVPRPSERLLLSSSIPSAPFGTARRSTTPAPATPSGRASWTSAPRCTKKDGPSRSASRSRRSASTRTARSRCGVSTSCAA